jgi:hypothetical protein
MEVAPGKLPKSMGTRSGILWFKAAKTLSLLFIIASERIKKVTVSR